jgi:eukaryotic-like serine/threonine-protein kinase
VDDLRARLEAALSQNYAIERELGRGGMAVVYLAQDLKLGRRVALKVLRPELSATLGTQRFLQEIKVAAGLAHPNILPLHDSGEAGGLLYYTMPYVQGESLRQHLELAGTLPLDDALRIAREVADALDYAHQQNVVHRDIKPGNILLEAGHAVVADFGVARAISAAVGDRVTATGLVVGTPQYMSPEQARGSAEVDGRSDIFSLGCVLYEMLIGRPPFADASPIERLEGRVRFPPALSVERPVIPVGVEAAVETALATAPGRRYQTAAEFGQALESGVGTVSGARRRARRARRWWVAGVGAAAALSGAAVVALPRILGAKLDGSLYVVVPFGHRGGAAPMLLNGDRCELLVSHAFQRWTDVRVVDRMQVQDALLRRGDLGVTLQVARDIARGLRAGRLVWGDVADAGDSTFVTAALYDLTRGGAALRHASVGVRPETSDLAAKFYELADSLLLGAATSREARPGALGTDVLAAWQAYAEGREALDRWDLVGAERAFQAALAIDREYAHANLWLAQTAMWAGKPASDWRESAARAVAGHTRLAPGDVLLAQALRRLADGQFSEACRGYRELVARDSADFVAWFGLGECQRRDRLVVPDPASPSRWRFRSSYRAAADAYRRALELVPSVHRAFTGIASQRLMRLFFTESNVFRAGYAVGADTLRFGAFPSLDHDTLAFVPYPITRVFDGTPEANPPSKQTAVERNRAMLRDIMRTWLDAFPGSSDAHEAMALVLETTGELDIRPSPKQSALTAVRRARALSPDPEQASRLAVTEVRLLVKLEQFERARDLADSVLAAALPEPEPLQARHFAGLAALTGRVYRTVQLLRLSAAVDTPTTWDGQELPHAPLAVKAVALELLGYAALGGPVDSLRVLKARVDQSVSSWAGPAERDRLRLAVLHVPVALAFAQLGLTDVHRQNAVGDYLIERQWALAHGDTAAVRAGFARIAALRSTMRPGDVAVEGTHNEALLLLQIGDTGAATQLLDLSLGALPSLGTYLLEQTPQAGAVVRAMALRAELAARAGDQATARRWARAVATLWSGADAPLEPVLRRMRTLASEPHR